MYIYLYIHMLGIDGQTAGPNKLKFLFQNKKNFEFFLSVLKIPQATPGTSAIIYIILFSEREKVKMIF